MSTKHKFNIIHTEEMGWVDSLKLVRSELGFEFLDTDGRAIIRAHNICTTGDFYVYLNNNINDYDYKIKLIETFKSDSYKGNPCTVFHFKIVEKNP